MLARPLKLSKQAEARAHDGAASIVHDKLHTPSTVFAHARLSQVGHANLPMTRGARCGVPGSCMAALEHAVSGI